MRRIAVVAWGCALASAPMIGVAQEAPEVESVAEGAERVPTPTDGLSRRLPPDAYRTEPVVGLPYRSLFRDTGAPYTNVVRPFSVGATVRQGDVDTGFFVDIPDIRTRFPLLDRGFEPQDADLKLGPLFFKLRALSGGLLMSDNVNRDETGRESGVIAITRLTASVYAQLTEGFQLGVSGNLTFLPLEGKMGVGGFSLKAPYSFGLDGSTVLASQIAWETMIGGWNLVFADEYHISTGSYSLSSRDDFLLLEGGGFDEADRAGRYVFRGSGGQARDTEGKQQSDTEVEPLYYSNRLSVATQRLLPGTVRLRISATHENLWYNQGNRGQPELRGNGGNDEDDAPRLHQKLSVSLTSERENIRFQPFASYRAIHTNNYEGFDQEFRLGIAGPITEQLELHADAGVRLRAEGGAKTLLWGLGLRHQAGPYTTQSIIVERRVLDLSEEITDHVSYHIHQILGPKVTGEAYVSVGTLTDLDDQDKVSDLFRLGARVTYNVGPKTLLRAGYTYSNISSGSGGGGGHEEGDQGQLVENTTHTLRLELTYRWTDHLQSRLLYQYQNRESNSEGNSYYENMIFLSLTKYFE